MTFQIEGNIIDVVKRDIFPGRITVRGGKIAGIERCKEKYRKYILPGLIDAHIHIESSMLPPSEFARIAVRHGTTATVSDPHEIANVLGWEGIEFMINDAAKVPLKFNFGAPSCVPATKFESAGAKISTKEIEEILRRSDFKYLSEMMNFPGVIYGDKSVLSKIRIAHKYGKRIDGHAPGLRGEQLEKYISAGITTDHEAYTLEEALEKISLGMKILIREGSSAKNYSALHSLIDDFPEMIMFCSDDLHPDDLLKGHLNLIIRRAIEDGHDLIDTIRAVTLNPVLHYGLDSGLLRKGDKADFIIVDSLSEFNVLQTYIDGSLVAGNGKTLLPPIKADSINNFKAKSKVSADFAVSVMGEKIRVIEAIDGELITKSLLLKPKIEADNVVPDTKRDILKIAVVNRYKNSKPVMGFIRGFGLRKGAIASSIAHDSHNIIAVGTNDTDICNAVNAIIKTKGGLAFSDADNIIGLSLPIAGIMSDLIGEETAKLYSLLEREVKSAGSKLRAPFMTLSFMSLLVIPELKLSDKGLFDGNKFEFTELFV